MKRCLIWAFLELSYFVFIGYDQRLGFMMLLIIDLHSLLIDLQKYITLEWGNDITKRCWYWMNHVF